MERGNSVTAFPESEWNRVYPDCTDDAFASTVRKIRDEELNNNLMHSENGLR